MGEWVEESRAGVEVLVPDREREDQRQSRHLPRYHVVLWDSDDHTFEYVERMLRELFGHSQEQCHQLAEAVDTFGRATVLTTTKEHAELKRDQILAYGKDQLAGCKGSMWATIEKDEV
jgi:ATP-dependent Clp protease adaptor protein ClpS